MILTAKILFWLSISAVVYAYLGYPPLIWLCSRLFSRRSSPPECPEPSLPRVTVLVSALNEEVSIAERVENNLAQDYPADRLEIVVASDGSTDRTSQIVQEYAQRHPSQVRLFDYPVRRGKASVLNESIAKFDNEIVVLSDANTFFEPDAIRNLVRWFADPAIGAVCGKLVLVDPQSGKNVDSMYWRYENFLKACEGRLGALLGSNGAIYAIRRQDYQPIPADTIIDDFMIPLLIRLRCGKRIAYDTAAIATEETPADVSAEFRRRVRIGAGGFQSIARLWPLALPNQGWTSFAFVSHKVLRWFCPAFLLVALLANFLLLAEPLYQLLLAGQLLFYSLAAIGGYLPGTGPSIRLLRLTTLFTSMNLALALGFWRWIAGQQRGTWQRTTR